MTIAKDIAKKFLILSVAVLIIFLSREKSTFSVHSASITNTQVKSATNAPSSNYDQRLHALNIELVPGTQHRKDSSPTPQDETRCKSIVYRTLITLPKAHRQQLKKLTLYYTDDGRRGLGGGNTIVLRCNNVTDKELAAVLAHEVGHVVDASLLEGSSDSPRSSFMDFEEPIYENDPSLNFYSYSWVNDKKLKPESVEADFVSTYAMSDPFEDFSETYSFYRYHGVQFEKLTKENSVLKLKYDFMKEKVFAGKEFKNRAVTSNQYITASTGRPFDVTVLPY